MKHDAKYRNGEALLLALLPGDIPVMLEHLPDAEEYAAAADHVRGIAQAEGINL